MVRTSKKVSYEYKTDKKRNKIDSNWKSSGEQPVEVYKSSPPTQLQAEPCNPLEDIPMGQGSLMQLHSLFDSNKSSELKKPYKQSATTKSL